MPDQPTDYPLPVQVVKLGERLTLVPLGGVVDYSSDSSVNLPQTGNRFGWRGIPT